MRYPAAGVVVLLGHARTSLRQIGERREQRFVTFREARQFGRPVVHLRVDVDRPLAVPWWVFRLVPNALQIGRLRTGTRTGDQEVPSKLKIERRQLWIALLLELFNAAIRRLAHGIGRAQIERHAME